MVRGSTMPATIVAASAAASKGEGGHGGHKNAQIPIGTHNFFEPCAGSNLANGHTQATMATGQQKKKIPTFMLQALLHHKGHEESRATFASTREKRANIIILSAMLYFYVY
jgi:hypothetical protein